MLKPVESQQAANVQPPKLEPVLPGPAGTQAIAFARQMEATALRVDQDTLVAFLAEIDEQGKKLLKHPVRAEIERYRALVGKFVKEALAQMTTLEKRSDRRNRAFTLVKEVDKKLAELTELLLGGQAKQIDVLAKLQEIRGMLVDLKI